MKKSTARQMEPMEDQEIGIEGTRGLEHQVHYKCDSQAEWVIEMAAIYSNIQQYTATVPAHVM